MLGSELWVCICGCFLGTCLVVCPQDSAYHSLKVLSEHEQPPVAWPRGVRVKDLPWEGASPVIKWGQERVSILINFLLNEM